MRLFKALLIFLVIPAMLAVLNVFQNYAADNMTLNQYDTLIMASWPFVLIVLFVLGIFMAIRKMGDK